MLEHFYISMTTSRVSTKIKISYADLIRIFSAYMQFASNPHIYVRRICKTRNRYATQDGSICENVHQWDQNLKTFANAKTVAYATKIHPRVVTDRQTDSWGSFTSNYIETIEEVFPLRQIFSFRIKNRFFCR